MIKVEFEENGNRGRFVLYENEKFAGEITYVWAGKEKFIIDHTGVETEFEGKGYGMILVMKAVEYAREKKVKILPLCPFVKAIFDKDKSFNDVRVM